MLANSATTCNMCYQLADQLFQVPGYHLPTCVKCSESITRNSTVQSYYQQQQQPPANQQIMAPPPLSFHTFKTSTIPNSHQHHQGSPVTHHKKFTAPTTATSLASTFELEQALMSMDGEILLGEEGQCPLCQKVFNRKTSLLNHIRNHSADKKFVCDYCQKGFSQQANLRNHTRIHTNDRPYVCIDCGKAFTQITNLNNHRRLHTGERPFVCIEHNCGRSFAQVTNLNNHMKTHHKIQQYVCSQCPRKFHTVTQLNHHLATHGIIIKAQMAPRGEFGCNMCPVTFHDEPQLKRHIQKHLEGRFIPCTVVGCNEGFSTKNQLNKHLQNQHPHEYLRRKESRQVPLSLLQLHGNQQYNNNMAKVKIEEDIKMPSQSHLAQIPIQIAGHSGTIAINLPSNYAHQHPFNADTFNNDATKKVLSNRLSSFNHFLCSFSPAPIASSYAKYVCNLCYNVFRTTHTLNRHIQKFHS